MERIPRARGGSKRRRELSWWQLGRHGYSIIIYDHIFRKIAEHHPAGRKKPKLLIEMQLQSGGHVVALVRWVDTDIVREDALDAPEQSQLERPQSRRRWSQSAR